MTDKLRKYVLPNIPYVFIGWVFLKLGTAYRLAAGAGFGEKLLGLGQTVGAAFADFAPGLAPFDWLVGIVGAVAFRLLIYFKSKNAKKYRRDAEYGSARWPAGRSRTFWTTRISWCYCRRRRATVQFWQSSLAFPSISSPISRTPIPARACCSMEMSPSRL